MILFVFVFNNKLEIPEQEIKTVHVQVYRPALQNQSMSVSPRCERGGWDFSGSSFEMGTSSKQACNLVASVSDLVAFAGQH